MKTLQTFALLMLAAAGAAAQSSQQTVFKAKVFNAITTPQASAPLPNIGQAVHIMMVLFPTASADVTGIVFRTEGSFDNTTYFPISEDITTATYNGSYAYAITRCNGPYPYVRLRYVTADAGNRPLTAHYTGAVQPIGLFKLSGTKYIADSPMAGASVSGPGQVIAGTYYVQNRRMTPITPSEWTSVNFDAVTERYDDSTSINIHEPAWATAGPWRMVCKALPAAPYVIRIHWLPGDSYTGGDAFNRVGAILRDSVSGKLMTYTGGMSYGGGFYHETWASAAGGATNSYWGNAMRMTGSNGIFSLVLTDDGTWRLWDFWNGQRKLNPVNYYSTYWNTRQANNTYLVPDQICFGYKRENGNFTLSGQLVGYDVNPTW